MHRPVSRAWVWLDTAVDWLSTSALAVMCIVSFVAVISRYVFNDSLTWSEELTRYIFMWVVFLGTAIGVRTRAHIAVDVFLSKQGPGGERLLTWLEWASTLAFAALIGIPGWTFVMIGMSNLSPAMEVPMGLVYAAPVVGSVLIVIYLFRPAVTPSSRDNTAI